MYRTKHTIIYDILSVIVQHAELQTTIMRKAHLSTEFAHHYLEMLLHAKMIEYTKYQEYEIRQKGIDFINKYRQLESLFIVDEPIPVKSL